MNERPPLRPSIGCMSGLSCLFGLSNVSSSFRHLMNEVLRPFFKKFVLVYFDDILVYSRDEASYMEHITQVFQVSRQQSLCANLRSMSYLLLKLFFLVMLSL